MDRVAPEESASSHSYASPRQAYAVPSPALGPPPPRAGRKAPSRSNSHESCWARVRLPLPRLVAPDLEADFVKQCGAAWREGAELPHSLAAVVAVCALGVVDAFGVGEPLAACRAAAGAVCVIASTLILFFKGKLPLQATEALFGAAVVASTISCLSKNTVYLMLSTWVLVLGTVAAGCSIGTASATLAVTVAVSASFTCATIDAASADIAPRSVSIALLVCLGVASVVFVRSRAKTLRWEYLASSSLNPILERRTGAPKARVKPSGRKTSLLDDPVTRIIDVLKGMAAKDRKLAEVVISLATVLATTKSGMGPTLALRKVSSDDMGCDDDAPVVDQDTAEWLEQMVLPWQKLQKRDEPAGLGATVDLADCVSTDDYQEERHAEEVAVVPQKRRRSVVLTESGNMIVAPDLPANASELTKLLACTTSPFFDVETLTPHTNAQPLLCLTVYFCNTYFLVDNLELDMAAFQRFVIEVEACYRPLPYHSALHASDVLVNAVRLMKHSESPVSVVPLDMLALIVACAVHDVDHPGVSNAFLVSTTHEIAVQHNDQSVLEHHHLSRAFNILRSEGCNFLKDFSYSQVQQFRHVVIELVLATDFAHHLSLVNQFKMMVASIPSGAVVTAPEEKLLLWRIVMKAADLGHCSKPTVQHRKWAFRIMEEMYRQGDAEARMGFVISAAMDRTKLGHAAKSQAGFLEYVCLPLFQAWHGFSHDDALLARVEANIRMWQSAGVTITAEDLQDALPDNSHFENLRGSVQTLTKKNSSKSRPSMDGVSGYDIGHLAGGVDLFTDAFMDGVKKAKERPDRGHKGLMSIGTVAALKTAALNVAKSIRTNIEAKRTASAGLLAAATPLSGRPAMHLHSIGSADSVGGNVTPAIPVPPTPPPAVAAVSDAKVKWLRDTAKAGSRHGLAALSKSARIILPQAATRQIAIAMQKASEAAAVAAAAEENPLA